MCASLYYSLHFEISLPPDEYLAVGELFYRVEIQFDKDGLSCGVL